MAPCGVPIEGTGVLVALCILPFEYGVGPGDARVVEVGVMLCWWW
jgi:hypothetical protein